MFKNSVREKAIAEGIKEGIKEGKAEGEKLAIYDLIADKVISTAIGAERLHMTVSDLEKDMLERGYKVPR